MKKIAQVKLSDEYIVDMHSVLGKGSTGSVYEGKNVKNNQKVAVKVIELSTIDNQVTEYLLKMEKKALMILQNPYILKGLRIMQDEKFCFLVTEFCNGGTLKKYIKDHGYLSEEKALKIIKAILLGYCNLVEKRIVHRDLKPANIMLNNGVPKIIDFGYCEIAGYEKPSLQYNVGSPSYMAPESYDHNIYNEKTEIWAIGMILYECLVGKTIDEGQKMNETYEAIHEYGITFPDHVSQKTRDLIKSCLSINPKHRPTCSEILKKYFPKNKAENTLTRSKSIFNETKIEERNAFNDTGKQSHFENRNSTPQPFTRMENISLYHSTATPKNVLKIQKILRESHTQRGIFGVLTNIHQQMIKNYENRVRASYSSYEAEKKYLKQPHQPTIESEQIKAKVLYAAQNDYGLYRVSTVKNSHNFKHTILNTRNIENFNLKVDLSILQQKCQNQIMMVQFKNNMPHVPFHQVKLNSNVKQIPFHSRNTSQTQRQRAVSYRI